MRMEKSELRRKPYLVALALVLLCLTICRGCSVVAGYKQTVKVRITDAETDDPVVNANIFRIYESDGNVSGRVFVSSANGIADIEERTTVSCGVALGDPNCNSIVYEDTVTGTMGKYVIDEGGTGDVIELELQVGNFEVGEIYSIEIVSISEPVDLSAE